MFFFILIFILLALLVEQGKRRRKKKEESRKRNAEEGAEKGEARRMARGRRREGAERKLVRSLSYELWSVSGSSREALETTLMRL